MLFSVLLILYAAFLHLAHWWLPPFTLELSNGVGTMWLEQWAVRDRVWEILLVVLLLFIQGAIANVLIMENRLAPQVTLFPGVFVVLLGCLLPAFLPFTGYHAANVFLLLAVLNLTRAYRLTSASDIIFNTGFWIGIASLFQPEYIWFLLGGWLALNLLRASRIREQVTLLIGALVPWLLCGFAFYWFDQFDVFWDRQWVGVFYWPTIVGRESIPYISILLMVLVVLAVLLNRRRYMLKTTMEVQKKIDLIYWFLFSAGVAALFAQPWAEARWLMVSPFCGMLLGLHFTSMSRRAAEAWHLFLLVLLFGLQFYPLIPIFSP